MVIGIGVDIIEIERLERALESHGSRLRDRLFTPREISYCIKAGREGERFATRFAAKEAARKALGAVRDLPALAWHEVEIISSADGAPKLEFHGRALEVTASAGITHTHVSLSHSRDQAIAFVLLERN